MPVSLQQVESLSNEGHQHLGRGIDDVEDKDTNEIPIPPVSPVSGTTNEQEGEVIHAANTHTVEDPNDNQDGDFASESVQREVLGASRSMCTA